MRGLKAIIGKMRLLRCERGATAVEYGLMIAMIVLALIAAINTFAVRTSNMWNNVATNVMAN